MPDLVSTRPTHPAAPLGRRAISMFEEIVEKTTIVRRPTKTSEMLVEAGLVFDRDAGTDAYGFPVVELSARIDAWDAYSDYLDGIEKR